jgi:hypothetical protein
MKSCLMLTVAWLLAAILAACGTPGTSIPEQDSIAKAASEATAIVQQARATALVLQARTMATALIEQAGAAPATPAPAGPTRLPVATVAPARPVQTPSSSGEEEAEPVPAAPATRPGGEAGGEASPAPDEEATTVDLLGVGFAADGGFIMVQFRAPPKVATKWWQGSISVTDEATGTVYNEIPVMPIIGPLIGRPVEVGQLGYAMLVNAPTPLQIGAVVTVVLGDYKFEHQTVQG